MKIKHYRAADMRQALRQVRTFLGTGRFEHEGAARSP